MNNIKNNSNKNKNNSNTNNNNNNNSNSNNTDYDVDLPSAVHNNHRWNNLHTKHPPHTINSGLYSGPQNNDPWMGKPVVPTTTYFMQVLLNDVYPPPPPGATEQYPTENRVGNNYTPMTGVKWFNSHHNNAGPFHIKVIDRQFSINNN